ncbi:MAG: hypothetical protein AAF602_16650 [Myxococcota bacterium]
MNLEASAVDLTAFRLQLAQLAVAEVCPAGASLKPLSAAGATLRYRYTTRDGVSVPPIDITPSVCAQLAP